jgi:hypothetical protein
MIFSVISSGMAPRHFIVAKRGENKTIRIAEALHLDLILLISITDPN